MTLFHIIGLWIAAFAACFIVVDSVNYTFLKPIRIFDSAIFIFHVIGMISMLILCILYTVDFCK